MLSAPCPHASNMCVSYCSLSEMNCKDYRLCGAYLSLIITVVPSFIVVSVPNLKSSKIHKRRIQNLCRPHSIQCPFVVTVTALPNTHSKTRFNHTYKAIININK